MGDIEKLLLIQNLVIDTKALREFCIYGNFDFKKYLKKVIFLQGFRINFDRFVGGFF